MKITELAEQATTIEYGVDNGFDRVTFDKEKFAQLIIAECVQVCMNEGASYEEKSAGAYQSNLYVTAIQRHFDESK